MKNFVQEIESDQSLSNFGSALVQLDVDLARPEDIDDTTDISFSSTPIPKHPQGVKPSGNSYDAQHDSRACSGVFTLLPDETLMTVLEYLDTSCLRLLGSTCKALFAFCSSDELWRSLSIENINLGNNFSWQGTWRSSYLRLDETHRNHIKCPNVFSDVLYRPFQCAHTPLVPYSTDIPLSNRIPKLKDMTAEAFSESWNDRPFVLTDPVRQWPVFTVWDTSTLMTAYGDVAFRQESVDWSLKTYVDYMMNTSDESPLYLFDRSFVEKMNLVVEKDDPNASYWSPSCFGEDLFTVLENQRPDSRWLIVGPARSGSTFHKDPNATSAWNAVLRGAKYWIMFPTHPDSPPPPGVYVSADQSEVTSPLSIAEWLISFHAEARRTPGCVEGICSEGEVLHVPSGWWHLVVNLEPSIAITQNFVPSSHLTSVLSFLKDKPNQVSGFKKDIQDPYATFLTCMEKLHPELLDEAMSRLATKRDSKKRKWDAVVDERKGFSFGFGACGDSDDDIP